MQRLLLILLLGFLGACGGSSRDFEETSIAELHDQMQRGELTSVELVQWYLDRIDAVDRHGPQLNSIIELNPDALDIARALDAEWRLSGPRGPLHGRNRPLRVFWLLRQACLL